MIVDVCMITYNHELYIAQAIKSVLSQQTDFAVRLIIGEDGSTDRTKEICKEYADKYPDKILLIKSDGNVGMIKNFIRTLQTATGKYIALCEGDDYWVDPLKLQKQVSFLENHKDYSICFHKCYILKGDNELTASELNQCNEPQTYSINDLAKGNIMHTPTVLYRNGLFNEFPKWFHQSPVGDYILHMLNAKHGDIYYIPEFMAVYRIHDGGVWSKKDETYILKNIEVYLGFLMNEYKGETKTILVNRYSEICWRLIEQKQRSLYYICKLAKINPRYLLIRLKLKYIKNKNGK